MKNKIINSKNKKYYKIFNIFTNKSCEIRTTIIRFIYPISKDKFLVAEKS